MSIEIQYQSGFGNEFATEAVAGALPVGQNAPQKHPLGLYTEQFSGTAFTAPRATNRRTWTYRIRPSVTHRPYEEIPSRLICSGPFTGIATTPNQLRWNPLPLPEQATDFVDGIVTLGGNGDDVLLELLGGDLSDCVGRVLGWLEREVVGQETGDVRRSHGSTRDGVGGVWAANPG